MLKKSRSIALDSYLHQVRTKYFKSESNRWRAQSGLCHFHCVVTAAGKRDISEGEGSVFLNAQHHAFVLWNVWRTRRVNSPSDDRQIFHKPGKGWVRGTTEGHGQSHITAGQSVHLGGSNRRNQQLTVCACQGWRQALSLMKKYSFLKMFIHQVSLW